MDKYNCVCHVCGKKAPVYLSQQWYNEMWTALTEGYSPNPTILAAFCPEHNGADAWKYYEKNRHVDRFLQ